MAFRWVGCITNLSENGNSKHCFDRTFFKEYSKGFLMVDNFGSLVIMFKVSGIRGISKIEYFNFSGTERVNKG